MLRRQVLIAVCAVVAIGCGGSSDNTGGTDPTNGTDSTDSTDTTDSTDMTDTTSPDVIDDVGTDPDDVPGTGGEDAETTSPDAPTCEAYCDAVAAACTGDNAQYDSAEACQAYCGTWAQLPLGAAADTEGNTVGCRSYHAGVASESAANAAIHCPHAGADGGGVCGSLCDSYCHLAATNCAGGDGLGLYADDAACATACADFAADGEAGATAGDSVQCRIYHLGVAGSDKDNGSAQTHCPHGGIDGGGVCKDDTPDEPTCEAYCAAITSACTGDNAQYTDEAGCLDYCDDWADLEAGTLGDVDGDTIGCRLYHAGVAAESAENATAHCAHAGPSGGNVCGDWCTNYCGLAMSNCTGDNALFDSDGSCASACEALGATGEPGDVDGDTVQCRIYHLGVAGSKADGAAATHCPHGAVDGGGVCVDDVVEAPTCEAYCAAVTASCKGENAQYTSEDACVEYCATWATLPLGTGADTSGNTVGCRAYHAGVAGGGPADAAIHCAHAGPSGGDVCGTLCENYCHLEELNCSDVFSLFTSAEKCAEACAAFPTGGNANDTSGNNVYCRIYHLGIAGSEGDTSAEVHCPHGDIDGGGQCVVPEPEKPTCDLYCATITANCTGDNTQYADEGSCLTYCGTFAQIPLGAAADTSGNTVGCRAYHAGVAGGGADDAAVHCPHAGPSGGNVCGTWCDTYCQLAGTNCTGDNELYADAATCDVACSNFPDSGAPGAVEGESVQCKIYHLGVAGSDKAGGSAAIHCPHGDVDGGGVCVAPDAPDPTCAAYCALVTTSCTGDNAQYTDEASCVDYCDTWALLELGLATDTDGDTVGCRTYHAGVAAGGPDAAAIHCDHAGPSGGDVCGSWCEVYCDLAGTNCLDSDALYADDAACSAACAGFSATGATGDTDGDTVQCKIYHLGVAGSDWPASAAIHCPHGAVDGGGVCVTSAVAGDTCDDAIPVGALPFTVSGATTGAGADYAYGDSDCAGGPNAAGAASADIAYVFTPGETAKYDIAIDAVHDATLYIVGDCADIGTTCLGASDLIGSGKTEKVTLELTAGTAVFIVVDGWSNATDVSGDYTLTVEKVAAPVGDAVDLVINEIDYDQPGSDSGEFIELYNADAASANLADYVLELVNGNGGAVYASIELGEAGTTLEPGKYLVIGDSAIVDALPAGVLKIALGGTSIQNGAPDGARIVHAGGAVTDQLSYEGDLDGASEGTGGAGTDSGAGSLARCPDGEDTDDNAIDFTKTETTSPGEANACDPVVPGPSFASVQPIFQTHCTGGFCHGGENAGGHDLANSLASATGASYYCPGKTKAECAIVRIEDGSMPLGAPGTVSAEDVATIQAWVDAGTPE